VDFCLRHCILFRKEKKVSNTFYFSIIQLVDKETGNKNLASIIVGAADVSFRQCWHKETLLIHLPAVKVTL